MTEFLKIYYKINYKVRILNNYNNYVAVMERLNDFLLFIAKNFLITINTL